MASQSLPLFLKSSSGKLGFPQQPQFYTLRCFNVPNLLHREFCEFELEGITVLSLLYLHHTQIVTIHCFAHFSVTTPSQGKALQNPSQISSEKCEYTGKEESYSEVQNCIGRALQYISLSILLFTRLCLITCQWNKAVKALQIQEAQRVSSKQQLMHKHQRLHADHYYFK